MPTRGGRGRPARRVLLAALGVVVLGAAACTRTPPAPVTSIPEARGGTLYVLLNNAVSHWDPQRMVAGPEPQFALRTFLRTLTTYPPSGAGFSSALAGDLATGTGTPADGGRTWEFTMRQDAKWQDGKQVTCADVKYGVSRNFAREITGGPAYATTMLDIPVVRDSPGVAAPAYEGPYTGVGQDLFDRAVTCEGSTITFHLRAPVLDFNQTVSLPSFAPFRKDQDKGAGSNLAVFSSGPYMLEGLWEPGNGGRFVRNVNWEFLTDPIRSGYPNVIDVREGIDSSTATQRIVDERGKDRFAVTFAGAPLALQPGLSANASIAPRLTNPNTPEVEYLLPSFRSPVMSSPAVRQAFATATNRDAFVNASGGPTAMTPSYSVLASEIPGHQNLDPFGATSSGDPAAARQVLARAGVALPVPVRLAYRKSEVADRAFAALKASWDAGGFAVTLEPVTGSYYRVIGSPDAANRYDVLWASSSADWPSGSTVLPNVFDGRTNLSAEGPGQDYGYFNDAAVNRAIDAARLVPAQESRDAAWAQVDLMVARAGGHIALAQHRLMFVHGSGVGSYQDNAVMGGYADLANIQVPQ